VTETTGKRSIYRVTYATQDEALRQVDSIRSLHGAWPGVISHRDGTFGLTYDPRGDEYRGSR
jgi:hypothetical protein